MFIKVTQSKLKNVKGNYSTKREGIRMNKRKIFGVMLRDDERQLVRQVAKQEERAESQMGRILLLEALKARGIELQPVEK